ncbi:pectinesterase family protein [Chitinophaga lutea]
MKILRITCLLTFLAFAAQAQQRFYSADMARTVMEKLWKDSLTVHPDKPVKWTYDQGVVLRGIEGLWRRSGNPVYLDYIRHSMDFFIRDDGSIRTYKQQDFNIDNVMPGRALLVLYKTTGDERYRKAAATLRAQLAAHPRTKAGGFWHKKIYPWQMWLDGLYMGQPFYAEYAVAFKEDSAWNDIARQFILMESVARDPAKGWLLHGYDESREQRWADPKTGRSPHVWARAMGWYGMGLVDVLEHFPDKHPAKAQLKAILERYAAVVAARQDRSGLWWNVIDQPGRDKNYFEASAACMFTYTLAKAVRLGLLSPKYKSTADKAYAAIVQRFIRKDADGWTHLDGTVAVSGLGGNPYRDGSFDYYMSEKVVTDDPKGVGAFIQAAGEMEMAAPPLTVSKDGKGDFTSIQAAINSLPDSAPLPRVIRIGEGVFREKIYIEKDRLTLVGAGRGKTVISQAIARDRWRCGHMDDWGVATVNVDGSDITFRTLTIENTFGFDVTDSVEIDCPSDTVTGRKMITRNGHQMALRTMNGTRIKAVGCSFRAYGGDTVSPWDVEDGMFYFRDCDMEGGVDLYCPRGWAWAEDCRIRVHRGTAAVWHDGSRHEDAKTVLRNCAFDGYDGFRLGRYHRDAQFYLIGCRFPQNMKDEDIYLVPTSNVIRWGRRVYYAGCTREGGDYAWHRDNLQAAPGAPRITQITPDWVFGGRWYPAISE